MTAEEKKARASSSRARASARTKGKTSPYADKSRRYRLRNLGERLVYRGGFPVYPIKYVLFGGESPRAAVRFYNGSDVKVTGVRFTVTEYDEGKKIIAEYTLPRKNLSVSPSEQFAIDDFPVSAECVRLDIITDAVISEGYEYLNDGESVSVNYGVKEDEEQVYFLKKPTCKVKKKKWKFALISALAVTAVTAAFILTAWRLGAFEPKNGSADLGTTLISVTQDVEA